MERESYESEARRVGRREVIAGAGIAAAAWATPSVIFIDVASAAGSGLGPPVVEVKPGTFHDCVTVNPDVTDTMVGETVFGNFGRGDGDNGPNFAINIAGAPPHSQAVVSLRICYEDTWEGAGSQTRFQDEIDVTVDGVSAPGFPNLPSVTNACIDYTFTVPHSAGSLTLEFIGTVTAVPEDFGIAWAIVEFV